MRWEEQRYQPYLARYGGAEIIVVPRDRELSNAQLSGLDPGWFQHEVCERTKFCDFPALVTTWTDGENGGWFRTTNVESGFWGFFYRPLLDRYRAGTLGFTPIHISQYLEKFPPTEEVEVASRRVNTEHHWGGDFMQWTGSLLQKKGWDEVRRASDYYHQVKLAYDKRKAAAKDAEEVRQLIVRALRPSIDRGDKLQLLLGQPLGASLLRRPGASLPSARCRDGEAGESADATTRL